MDLALHPNFATNHYVYLTYTKPVDEKKQITAIARMKFENNAITESKDILVGAEAEEALAGQAAGQTPPTQAG